ncbi:MAG: hypothetical protein MUC31_07590, partial [Bacteroidales bacterium]|nr:hypothetical protein [Bacteroidales bacterium]
MNTIYSQNEDIVFENYSVDQGLPSSLVPCLFQDRQGYLWFGTYYGLSRYDGYEIISFTHREGDTTSISNSIINAICDDREGNIWSGHFQGLDKLNPSTGKFTRYILNPKM